MSLETFSGLGLVFVSSDQHSFQFPLSVIHNVSIFSATGKIWQQWCCLSICLLWQRTHCTSLIKSLTLWLTMWLSVDVLKEMLTLG